MEHAILHETIDGQRVNFYPETGFDDVLQTDGNDEITLRMVLEGMDAAIALLQNGLAAKANAADVYTKDNLYTKTETNNLLSNKSNKAATLAGYGIADAYTKTQTDNLFDAKANKATTLAGYGITNAYTKSEADSLLSGKANTSDVTASLNDKANKSDTYTKTEVDDNLANYLPLSGGDITDTLTVKGKAVERVNSSDTNYIRYENGLQICFGNASGGNGKVNTHTFPQAFTSLAGVTCTGVMGTSTDTFDTSYSRIVTIRTVTNTNFTWQINGITSNSGTSCRYIAIGYWK